jgi:hypothetical protein
MPIPPKSPAPSNKRQPLDEESLLRSIAANTPGVEYDSPSGQLGSYGRGPLGEPTFAPFHPNYVAWLKDGAQEAASSDLRQLPAANSRMPSIPQSAEGADPADARKSSSDGRLQLAQNEVSTGEVSGDDSHRYYPHFHLKQPVVPPPPPPYVKTKKQLLDQATGDEAWARGLNETADALEKGSDSLDDLDPADREHLEEQGGAHSTEIDGALMTGGWLSMRHSAKFFAERARKARAKAASMPK